MNITEALKIVLDLAEQNVLDDDLIEPDELDSGTGLAWDQQQQLEACHVVSKHLASLEDR